MSTKKMNAHELIIIGGGPAGYTAAIYAARANLKPLQFVGFEAGGQLMITTDVDNYPGFAKGIQGPQLMQEMRQQAERFGTIIKTRQIVSVNLKTNPFVLKADDDKEYLAKSLIIATGAKAKWLNTKGEEEFRGFGVSACATCDGFFFQDQNVAVIGGGNSAVEEALFLTKFAKKVFVIHRRDSLRAEKISQDHLFKNPKVEMIWDTVVEEICGANDPKHVTHLKLKNIKTNKISELKIDGVFVAIGHQPMTELFKGQLDTDAEGYLLAKPGSTQTKIPGVFAAGDVQDKVFRQAVTAAGQGCMAALEAQKWLEH